MKLACWVEFLFQTGAIKTWIVDKLIPFRGEMFLFQTGAIKTGTGNSAVYI